MQSRYRGPWLDFKENFQRKSHLHNDFKMRHFPVSEERYESNNSEKNTNQDFYVKKYQFLET